MTNEEHIKIYNELEKQGIFDKDPNPVDWNMVYTVDDTFPYIPKTFWHKFTNFLKKVFIINPFVWYYNKFVAKTKIIGKENLKGVKSAIVTCNHVFIFDCIIIMKALAHHKKKYCTAEHNNLKGFLGNMMRAGGIMPLSKNYKAMKNFTNAVEHYLLYDNYIVFYPEQAMWHMYEKPRPLKNGAFHFAAKFDVPIIPMFISYRNSGKIGKDGLEKKYMTISIMKPIYPEEDKPFQEKVEIMKDANYEACVKKYEEMYNKKLEYTTIKKD